MARLRPNPSWLMGAEEGEEPGHQAAYRDSVLPRNPAPEGPPGSRAAHRFQCSHPQGPQENRFQEEEVTEKG